MKKQTQSQKAARPNEDRRRKANAVGAGEAPRGGENTGESILVVPEANGTILPGGQNIALPTVNSGVSSSNVNHTSQEQNVMATLKFRKTDKSGSSSYSIEGLKSSVYFNKGMFKGDAPATLEISLPEGFSFGEPGAKPAGAVALTKEQREAAAAERKAKLAAMTPAEKAQLKLENAKKALEAAEKAAAKAASL